jgi:hypothetical protein
MVWPFGILMAPPFDCTLLVKASGPVAVIVALEVIMLPPITH